MSIDGGYDIQRGEKDQEHDRDNQRDQDVLPTPEGQQYLKLCLCQNLTRERGCSFALSI